MQNHKLGEGSQRDHCTESCQKLWREPEKKGMVLPRKEIGSMGDVQKCINNKRYIKNSVLIYNSRTTISKNINLKNGNKKHLFHKTGNHIVECISTGGFESKSLAIDKRTQTPFWISEISRFSIFQATAFWKRNDFNKPISTQEPSC